MLHEKLCELDLKIRQLTGERQQIVNEIKAEKSKAEQLEYIKSLKWTKDCSARFKVRFDSVRGPLYHIYVEGDPPHVEEDIVIMGTSDHNSNNLVYGENFMGYSSFRTSSEEMLSYFLKIVKFSSFNFEEYHSRVLFALQLADDFKRKTGEQNVI